MATLRKSSQQKTQPVELCESAFLSLPNALSFLRILLTPIFLYLAFKKHENTALFVFVIAALTDWADGYTARKFGQSTQFGQLLDPLADKILLVASFIGFYFLGTIPFWILALVVGRDSFILIIGIFLLALKSPFEMKPHFVSKLNTAFQIFYITFILCHMPQKIIDVAAIIMASTTIVSGLLYAINLIQWLMKKHIQKSV